MAIGIDDYAYSFGDGDTADPGNVVLSCVCVVPMRITPHSSATPLCQCFTCEKGQFGWGGIEPPTHSGCFFVWS